MASKAGVGFPQRRQEDLKLATGTAKFTDDFTETDTLHAALLRSQYGHAEISNIDTSSASTLDGVRTIVTGIDIAQSEIPGFTRMTGSLPNQNGTKIPLLAASRVRFVGEPIAIVIAEDKYTASQAVNLIDVHYDRLETVIDETTALTSEAPLLHDDHDSNQAFDWEFGDHAKVEERVTEAEHVVEVTVCNQRLIPNAMEPRSILANYDADTGQLTVRMTTQVPHRARSHFAKPLGLSEENIRVITPAVGGGFGSRDGAPYSDEPLVALCAMQLGQPVKWVAKRTESHQTDHHGRDVQITGKLALDSTGNILALRVDGLFNLGAYLGWPITPATNCHYQLSNLYNIPEIAGQFIGAYTNKSPIGPYRGAGTPNAIQLLERLMDEAAVELEIGPDEIRRRNFIMPNEFPFETAVGVVYDSGEYEKTLMKALDIADYSSLRERQRRLRNQDRFYGIGIAGFSKKTGVGPSRPETCRIRFDDTGTLEVYCGTADQGQGHATTFTQLLVDELDVPATDIEIHEGDTNDLPTGRGTFGCRSVPIGGSAVVKAAKQVREQARQLAATMFESAPEDIEFQEGHYRIIGSPDRSLHISEVGKHSYSKIPLPDTVEVGLETLTSYDPEAITYPYGFHVVAIEVDPELGEIAFDKYVAVDDVGVQINPLLVKGQILGGIAQGIGQAMYEEAFYDSNGTLQAGSFSDYAIPRAIHLPEITLGSTVTPCPHNPIGAKGAGESGNNGAPPAIVNAVVDALRPLGVDHVDTPLTSERIWRVVQQSQ